MKKNNGVLKKFGLKVKRLRLQKRWTQKNLALRSKLHRNYISDVERGQRNIALQAIFQIAKGLEIKIKDLMDLENE